MSVSSINSSSVAAANYGASRPAAGEGSKTSAAPEISRTIADHVAAADEHEPVRSFNSKVGTLLDTYL